jgi:hypothetical protein
VIRAVVRKAIDGAQLRDRIRLRHQLDVGGTVPVEEYERYRVLFG